MKLFTSTSVLVFCSSLAMAWLLLAKGWRNKTNLIWSGFCLSVALWGFGSFFYTITTSEEIAFKWIQVAFVGVILPPVLYSHFVFSFLRLRRNVLIFCSYILAFIFIVLTIWARDFFLGGVQYIFNQFYWQDWHTNRSKVFLLFYVLFYWTLLLYSFSLIVLEYFKSHGIKRNQLRYFILGSCVGWVGAECIFLPNFGFSVYPALFNLLIAFYPLIIGYAIVRYRLMDISVVLTRTTIFIAVYSLVLGIPFAIALGWEERLSSLFGSNWWMIPLTTSTILATAGPFIYLHFQKRAEERLFQEQIRYQTTLRQASLGMGRIKDLKRLVTLIVHIVTRTVRLEHSMIFLHDPKNKNYCLGAMRSRRVRFKPQETIPYNSAIINHLSVYKNPIVYDEIKQRTQDYGDSDLTGLLVEMDKIRAALIVPSFLDDKLVAVIVMGRKLSGQMFTGNDLASLQILANQAALGIENSQYYDDIKKAHQRLFQAEKLAYVGTLAGSVVHEIRNPLTSIKAFLQYLPQKFHEPDFREKFERLIPNEIRRIEGIVNQLLELVKRRPERLRPVNIKDCLNATLELLETSFQLKRLKIRTDYPAGLLMVSADEEHLRQAFMNLFLNAVQAMEEGGTLTIRAEIKNAADCRDEAGRGGRGGKADDPPTGDPPGPVVEIAISDTGPGIPPEILAKLFTPFQTSKPDGIGLGLSITREIIENHNGTIRAESSIGKGSTFTISLPAEKKRLI